VSRSSHSLPPSYFERLYGANPDPWGFATSDYEQAKYDATLAALQRLRYTQALEVGCSIGVLTARLAQHCQALLAVDVVESALDAARRRCAGARHIQFARMRLPDEEPQGRFDLILLSEVVYYWDRTDLARVATFLEQSLLPGGDLLLVHWTGATDYPLSGDEAATGLLAAIASFTTSIKAERTDRYRLDLVRRVQHEPRDGG
jgi:2-polyprenyl-3-methyl-5-hydroxy-6-metoxy-1,4-benzoquinol methylase